MKQDFKATFGDVKIGKKTTIAVEIKGTMTDQQKLDLLAFAQSDGFIQIATAQQDINDYQKHTGIPYKLENGEVKVDANQLDIDEVIGGNEQQEQEPEQPEDGWKSEEAELTPEMEQQAIMVDVNVLKAFKYQEKNVKKGEVIKVPLATANGLESAKVVKIIPSEELPF
jgi:hypothetical protein